MGSTTSALILDTAASEKFHQSTVGKKAIMAVTGIILFGFVIVHMLGNLQIYLGPEKLNSYSALLQSSALLLWSARLVLLLSVILHITTAVQLAHRNLKARPIRYARKRSVGSNYAARTMIWSGPILFAFVVYHLLHFTTGDAHPDFIRGDVYHNVVAGFRNPLASGFYIAAMLMLGAHIYHGAWSMFQTLGFGNPRYVPVLKRFAALSAAALTLGNISIPVSVLTGLVR